MLAMVLPIVFPMLALRRGRPAVLRGRGIRVPGLVTVAVRSRRLFLFSFRRGRRGGGGIGGPPSTTTSAPEKRTGHVPHRVSHKQAARDHAAWQSFGDGAHDRGPAVGVFVEGVREVLRCVAPRVRRGVAPVGGGGGGAVCGRRRRSAGTSVAFSVVDTRGFLRFDAQSLRDARVPCHHVCVGPAWESFIWKLLRKRLSVYGVAHVVDLQGALHERDVFVGSEQELDGLPCHEAGWLEGGDGGGGVAVVFGVRLDRVQASEGFVYEGDGLRGHVQKQGVVVAANGAVEGCKLSWGKVCGVVAVDG